MTEVMAIAFFTCFFSFIAIVIKLIAIFRQRKKIGEGYENDLIYQGEYRKLLNSVKIFVVSLYVLLVVPHILTFDFERAVAVFFFVTIFVTAGAFIVYWWKKRTARIKAGENYQEDENYKKISLHKRIIGITCILSFFLLVKMIPEPTPEELAAREARLAAEQAEQERLAAEKAEQERIAVEKSEQERIAAEQAEQERIAAEQAEQERIAAEKAEQDRIAAEKAEQERIATTENKKPALNKKEEKGFFAGLFDDAKEFAGGVLDNEVKVCDLENCSVYFSPTSKKFQQWGIIFKDEGYKITVIFKYPNGKKVSTTYYFKELSNGWKYQTELARANEWAKVKEDYVYDENNPSANDWNIASLIFQKSKHFPTLPEL